MNGSILRASKSKIYIESPSKKRNLVIANVFCQSLGPSLYRGSTVEHLPNRSGPDEPLTILHTLLHQVAGIALSFALRTSKRLFRAI